MKNIATFLVFLTVAKSAFAVGNLDISKDFKDSRYDFCIHNDDAVNIKFLPDKSLGWEAYVVGDYRLEFYSI